MIYLLAWKSLLNISYELFSHVSQKSRCFLAENIFEILESSKFRNVIYVAESGCFVVNVINSIKYFVWKFILMVYITLIAENKTKTFQKPMYHLIWRAYMLAALKCVACNKQISHCARMNESFVTFIRIESAAYRYRYYYRVVISWIAQYQHRNQWLNS